MKMRLADTGLVDTIDFAPLEDYVAPQDREVSTHKTLNGSLYTYKWSQKGKWEVPINIELADRDIIFDWWENMTELYLYDDYDDTPAQKYIVLIINDDDPLQMVFPSWKQQYEGTLILREV